MRPSVVSCVVDIVGTDVDANIGVRTTSGCITAYHIFTVSTFSEREIPVLSVGLFS